MDLNIYESLAKVQLLLQNRPKDVKEINLKYLDKVVWCNDESKKIQDEEKKKFIANSLLVVTRILELYNKNADGGNRFDSNNIDFKYEFASYISTLKDAIQNGFILSEFQKQELIQEAQNQIRKRIDEVRKIVMRPNLSQEDLTEFFAQHEIKVFDLEDFALYGVSSFDGTISYFNSKALDQPNIVQMLQHEMIHGLFRYKKPIDLRQISPERNQYLKIDGKPYESGEFYDIFCGEKEKSIHLNVFTKLDQNYYKKQME